MRPSVRDFHHGVVTYINSTPADWDPNSCVIARANWVTDPLQSFKKVGILGEIQTLLAETKKMTKLKAHGLKGIEKYKLMGISVD